MFRSRRSISRPHAYRAFTLIEILVVVAIIALLVSILMPSLAAARRQARITVCITSLRTIGQGTYYYAQASKDDLPAGYKTNNNGRVYTDSLNRTLITLQPWEFVYPYVMKQNVKQGNTTSTTSGLRIDVPVFQCPEDRQQHTTSQRPINGQQVELGISYGANLLSLYNDPADATMDRAGAGMDSDQKAKGAGKLSKIRTPAQIVSYFDNGDDGLGINEFADADPTSDSANPNPKAGWITSDCAADYRLNQCTFEGHHKTGGSFGYYDGHVTFHSMNYSGPYYGLPHFPSAWIPNYNRNTWSGAKWIKNWETNSPRKSFREVRAVPDGVF